MPNNEDDIEGYIKISRKLIPLELLAAEGGHNLCVLKARGNNLTDFPVDGRKIEDGDYIMVLKGCPIEHGDIVVMSVWNSYEAYAINLECDGDETYLMKNKGVRVVLTKAEAMKLYGKVIKVFKMPH